ncbi:MAG: F0F1 ATP synthase subunit epsilon [Candidatus Anammoxibacter sp.]
MAKNTFKLNVLTPERNIFGDDVRGVTANGTDGCLGILPKHAPLLTSLEIGILTITGKDGSQKKMTLNGGFLEVINNEVTVLAETAENVDDIDVKRAESAKERAQQRLDQKNADTDLKRAGIALKKAVTRLQVKQG